jgi:hypothetical protein
LIADERVLQQIVIPAERSRKRHDGIDNFAGVISGRSLKLQLNRIHVSMVVELQAISPTA